MAPKSQRAAGGGGGKKSGGGDDEREDSLQAVVCCFLVLGPNSLRVWVGLWWGPGWLTGGGEGSDGGYF